MADLKLYRKKALQPMRPYVPAEDLTGVSVSERDTPGLGGMIAVNPNDPNDRWYVAQEAFERTYEPAKPTPEQEREREAMEPTESVRRQYQNDVVFNALVNQLVRLRRDDPERWRDANTMASAILGREEG